MIMGIDLSEPMLMSRFFLIVPVPIYFPFDFCKMLDILIKRGGY